MKRCGLAGGPAQAETWTPSGAAAWQASARMSRPAADGLTAGRRGPGYADGSTV